jgi:hypothetical protein
MSILTSSLIGLLVLSPGFSGDDVEPDNDVAPDYSAKAVETKWKWDAKTLDTKNYAKGLDKKYKVDINSENAKFPWSNVILNITAGDKIDYTTKVNQTTPFLIRDETMYVAVYNPSSSGCSVKAVDLTSGKELWNTHLQGIGPVAHFRYNNRVTFEFDKSGAIVVFGFESSGKYVEFVDPKSGKTLANKKFKQTPGRG